MQTNIKTVDNYLTNNFKVKLDKCIGRGKYGVVYSGVDKDRNLCAIKVISLPDEELEERLRELYGDNIDAIETEVSKMMRRFDTEIQSMTTLNRAGVEESKHIIKINEHLLVPDDDGIRQHLVISMELARPLKKYLNSGNVTIRRVMEICHDVAKGLSLCHKMGIIHRDIKEDNLFVDIKNNVKIGDFGVANIGGPHVSKKTEGVGTPHYMAPEMKRGDAYDARVDIYSLGIVMYMLLNNNKPPFFSVDVDEHEAYQMRMSGKPLPPPRNAPAELSDIVLKCCAYNPNERYRTMNELMEDLEYAENAINSTELNKQISYPARHTGDTDWWDNILDYERTRTITVGPDVEPGKVTLYDTVSVFADIIKNFGQDKEAIDRVRGNKLALEDEVRRVELVNKKLTRILVGGLCIMAVLFATLAMLYPKTAIFYSNDGDNRKIYVKYLFLPERKLSDKPATYLTCDGLYIYFSDTYDVHKLYKANIFTGKDTMLLDRGCEYDIVIGDYIYFTDYYAGEKLYRIKKDGTGLQLLVDFACRDLKNINGDLQFLVLDSGETEILDVTTIEPENS